MKVLHVLDHTVPYFSGYSFRTKYILETQKRFGLIPLAVTSPKHEKMDALLEEIQGIPHYRTRMPEGFLVRSIRKTPFLKEKILMKALRQRVFEIARDERVDLIHAHSPILNGIPALKVARRLHLPVIYEVRAFWEDAAVDHGTLREHSLKYGLIQRMETDLIKKVDLVITICRGLRDDLIARGISAEKIAIVTNGVETSRFRPPVRNSALATRLGLDGKVTLGFLGSFYRYEGLDLLVEAFRALITPFPHARLLLVGDGEGGEELRGAVMRDGLEGKVLFTGNVPHDEVQDYYSVMDVAVYPRKKMRLTETVTPLKTLEAMSMERPVICSDLGGFREIVRDGVTGLLFRAGDVGDLVARCRAVIADPGLRENLAKAARIDMQTSWDWQEVIRRQLSLYESLVEHYRSPV
ncbi:MAG: glycosyltransferase, exosortase A system-associated [Acidobacteria bacterium]|nr:glycosyltransferase, exosortase A system-associated [Acidobacteriota bacterium]MBI3655274.1 glycosyltransferase, exosortase A system-associated [Acidobacteriota bacterium]